MSLAPAPKDRRTPCWIEAFVDATAVIPSPEIFRLWSGISAVSGALERRVYTVGGDNIAYPNLFVLLVSPPGVGKTQAIARVGEAWRRTKKLHVAPDDMTKASLIDELNAARELKVYSSDDMEEYHSLIAAVDELGVLLPANDLAFMSTANKLFDCPPVYQERRRGRKDEPINMVNPHFMMLAGSQPDFLSSILPPEAWGMGFMSRMIMVYAGKRVQSSIFSSRPKADLRNLDFDLKTISELHGRMHWEPDAEALLEQLHIDRIQPEPDHLRLKHYVTRRSFHLLKLSMIASVSRGNSLLVTVADVLLAKSWLLGAEATMPEIFKDMAGKSDVGVIRDFHYYLWQLYGAKRDPIHRARLEMFLFERTPAYNVEKILQVCLNSGVIETVPRGATLNAATFFIPGDKDQTKYD